MKKIIITGAGGLVGLNLLRHIDSNKYDIIALDKDKENLKFAKKINKKIKIVCADLSLYGNWEEFFKGGACVIQLQAQISDPEEEPYVKNNIISVQNVIKACEKYNVKNLIHISSSVVLSVAKDCYTKTKTIGENLVKKSKLKYTILRPPLMYGAFNKKHLEFIVKKFEKIPIVIIPGKGKYIRQPLYVGDFVKIIICLIERKPEKKIYNIIGKEKIYFIDLIKIIFEIKEKKKIFLKIPLQLFLFLLKLYNLLTNKKPFIPEQLTALTAGDIFPVEDWEEEFKIKYTPFREGVKKI